MEVLGLPNDRIGPQHHRAANSEDVNLLPLFDVCTEEDEAVQSFS